MNQLKENNGFIKYVAYLQILGIILVVFGHSFHTYPSEEHGKDLLIYKMLYSFRMPLFMFVSGFLMVFTTNRKNPENRLSSKKFIFSKIKRLLIPFFVLSIITFIPRCLLSNMADDVIELNFNSWIRSLVYSDSLVIPYFWFLQASFILLSFCYIAIAITRNSRSKKLLSENSIFILLILIFLILHFFPIGFNGLFSIEKVCELGIYFVLGASYGQYHHIIDRYIHWTSIPCFLLFVILWVVNYFIWHDTSYIIICSCFGVMMCISLAKLLVKYNICALDHLIGSNYMIFLLSWYCNVATQQILYYFVPQMPWWILSILSFSTGIYIPWLAYKYMQRNGNNRSMKAAAFMLGQKIKQPINKSTVE